MNNIDILIGVQYLLQLGEGFGFPINKHNIDRTLIEFIKNIENNIIGRRNNIINFVRNNTVSILEKFQNDFPRTGSNNKLLFDCIKTTKIFVKNHPEVLISKADKANNVTVAKNKLDYISKMKLIFSDNNTYEMITKDSTKKFTSDLRNMLSRWKGKR